MKTSCKDFIPQRAMNKISVLINIKNISSSIIYKSMQTLHSNEEFQTHQYW